MLRVEGHTDLYRDEKSGAIINCDKSGYEQYIKMRDEKRKQKDEIQQLKNDVSEIKSLLREILNGTKSN
jgi:SPX domain protein involved in polyphosphate accumulation